MSSPSDEALVRRAAGGDVQAFDGLVRRYRGVVLRIAAERLPGREPAEDAAQEAFLEAYAALPSLRDPARFEGWLAVIARRVAGRAAQRHATRDRALEEWTGCGTRAVTSGSVGPAQARVAERVREAIEELSERHHRVLTLHHLEGREVAEIGRTLGLPTGTVKRILFEARQQVREEVSAMCVFAQSGPAKELTHWIDGGYDSRHPRNVFTLMGGLLAQRTCLATNKRPKTLDQLVQELRADEEYVNETLQLLLDEGTMIREGDTYRANFPALAAEDWQALTGQVRTWARAAADELSRHLPPLQAAYERAPMSRRWPWETVIWPVVAIFTANLAVRRVVAAEERPDPPPRASGAQYWLHGHETVEGEEPFWVTGFSCCPPVDADHIGYGAFSTYGLERKWIPFRNVVTRFLALVDGGVRSVPAIAERLEDDRDEAEGIAAQWVSEGLLTNGDGQLGINFPLFRHEDDDALLSATTAAAEAMAEGALRQAGAAAVEELRARGYAHLGEQLSRWPHFLRGSVCGEAVHCLYGDGALPAPPQPAPVTWAFFGWEYGIALTRW